MEINKKLCLVALASTALILFLTLTSTNAATTSSGFTETKINVNGEASVYDMYGNNIVLVEDHNHSFTYDIYTYNLSTHKESQITTSGWAAAPAIYGNIIVWEDHRNGNWDIYMYDLSTKKETKITTSVSDQYRPSIYGNRIVWEDWRNGENEVYIYDLSTSKETRIAQGSEPKIYDDRVVFDDVPNGEGDIYMYDLSTKKETQITTNGLARCPAIYGDRIVWSAVRNESENIYMYDLSTEQQTQITNSGSVTYYPAIYGDRIVWSDHRNESENIYMYDLSTKKETQITTSGLAVNPVIYGNTLLWNDWRNNDENTIYMTSLSLNLPVPDFSVSPTSGKAPLTVAFTDESTGTPTKWKWNFGDGSKSYLQNPTHKYSKAGVYTVSLTVKNTHGSNTVTKTDYVKVIAKPVAVFSASPTSGKTPLNVKFTDTSTGTPAKWKWDFGDGSKSYIQNPIHKYSKAGVYTVSLTVKNTHGSNTIAKTDYIKVVTKPVAAFSASPISGKYPLNVKFTDKSTGTPTKWKWDFGDGTKSFLQNPTHKYSKAGKYTVTLKVTNAAGINTATKSNYITVTGTSQAPTADFWGWPLSGKAPLKVTFTETSKGSPTSWKWDFGDGKYSTEKSPTHTYSAAGTYTVKLTATNEAGSSTKLKWKYIKVAK